MKISISINGKQAKRLSPSAPKQSLAILDVGHGNCAVLIYREGVTVIDTGLRSSLIEYLVEREVTTIDTILISHADEDHIGGLVQLLSSGKFRIRSVRLNTDSEQDSKLWDDLLYELGQAQSAGELEFGTSLTRDNGRNLNGRGVQIEVLGPSKYLAAKGPGSTDRKGRKLTSNSVSVVTRLLKDGKPIALLPGDVDSIGMDDLRNSGVDATAPIVVFPHHGGRTGSTDMATFAKHLCEFVSPVMVIFSIGRGRYGTPRPEIVSAVRERVPYVWIACTQLSEHCAQTLPKSNPRYLHQVFSQGQEDRKCCAGTILIDLDDFDTILPDRSGHQAYITDVAPTALCRSTN